MAKSFRELVVWQKSITLTTSVYRATSTFPKGETYGLVSQMRRAAVSIASNIAEGSARGSKKDFRQFVGIARGSNYELQTQVVISRNLAYGNLNELDEIEKLSHEVGKMLSKLSDYLLATPSTPENRQLKTEN